MHRVWSCYYHTIDLDLTISRVSILVLRPRTSFCGNVGKCEQLGVTPFIAYGIDTHSNSLSSLLYILLQILDCSCEDTTDFQPNQEVATLNIGRQARLHD
jgi:hypothetical protein